MASVLSAVSRSCAVPVPAPPGPWARHPLALQAERLPVLRASGNRNLCGPVKGRHLDGVADGRLDHVDPQLVDDVLVLASKLLVRPDPDHDVEVAGGSSAKAGLAFADDPDLRARVDPGRNL